MKNPINLFVLCLIGSGSSYAAVSMIPASGWNYDTIHNGSGPYATGVSATMNGGLGQPEGYTWVEAGTYLNPSGELQAIPGFVAGINTSLTGNGTFSFQPFDGNNTIALDGGQSAILTLDTAASYSQLALFGASGFGAKTASVSLNFTDSTSTEFLVASGTGIGTDWFNNNADKAVVAGASASNRSEDGNLSLFLNEDTSIGINESLFSLSATDQLKSLQSVTITNTGGDRMMVFAISGDAVPEPTSAAMLGLGGLALMLRRRK